MVTIMHLGADPWKHVVFEGYQTSVASQGIW